MPGNNRLLLFFSIFSLFFPLYFSFFCDPLLCILNSWSYPRMVSPSIQVVQIPWARALRDDVIYVILMTFSIVLKCHRTWLTECVSVCMCQRLLSMHNPTSFCLFRVALCLIFRIHIVNNSNSRENMIYFAAKREQRNPMLHPSPTVYYPTTGKWYSTCTKYANEVSSSRDVFDLITTKVSYSRQQVL